MAIPQCPPTGAKLLSPISGASGPDNRSSQLGFHTQPPARPLAWLLARINCQVRVRAPETIRCFRWSYGFNTRSCEGSASWKRANGVVWMATKTPLVSRKRLTNQGLSPAPRNKELLLIWLDPELHNDLLFTNKSR